MKTLTKKYPGMNLLTLSVFIVILLSSLYGNSQSSGASFNPQANDAPANGGLAIGQYYEGGIIAYILQPGDPGYIAGEIKGLIAAPSDQGTAIWYNGIWLNCGASGSVLGTGNANTNTIVACQGGGNYAARLCYDLVLNGYDDWYLPSIDELYKLYLNQVAVGGFFSSIYWGYWSSTEEDPPRYGGAYGVLMISGQIFCVAKNGFEYIRPIRSFSVTSDPPAVTTTVFTDIAQTTATSGGDVTSDGGATVTARGVCWSTSTDPTITGPHTTDGSGTGTFVSNLTGLTANTPYYVRAYATNGAGTSYGNQLTFNTLGEPVPCPGIPTVTYGGKTYNTVQIGTQCWFKENLNIGTKVNGSDNQTNNSIIEKYCYNDDENLCNTYGGLYQWNEMMQYVSTEGAKGICPTGWHLPTDAEFSTLSTYLGGEPAAGGKMKETEYTHWTSPNTDATNSSGFTALPGGYRYLYGYLYLANDAYFWSSSQADVSYALYRYLTYYDGWMNKDGNDESLGFSVRCLKDQTPPSSLILQNILVPNGQTICFNATGTITAAGSGTTFTVQNGGSVTMIAGQSIQFLQGSTVEAGGYLSAYIAPGGPYCPSPSLPSVISGNDELQQQTMEQVSFKIYPNPTTGSFILELKGDAPVDKSIVEIYGMRGDKVLTEVLNGVRKQEFSLANKPVGLYFIRVISGNQTETGKIIKQ